MKGHLNKFLIILLVAFPAARRIILFPIVPFLVAWTSPRIRAILYNKPLVLFMFMRASFLALWYQYWYQKNIISTTPLNVSQQEKRPLDIRKAFYIKLLLLFHDLTPSQLLGHGAYLLVTHVEFSYLFTPFYNITNTVLSLILLFYFKKISAIYPLLISEVRRTILLSDMLSLKRPQRCDTYSMFFM